MVVMVGVPIVNVGSRDHRQHIVTGVADFAVRTLDPTASAVELLGIILRKKEVGDLLPLLVCLCPQVNL